MQSTKLPAKGEFYFLVSHRFGDLAQGMDNFFGLDNAFTKLGGIYGVSNWLAISASRHTYQKTYEFAAKYKMSNQEVDGFPVTIVGYNTMDINSELKKNDLMPGLQYAARLNLPEGFVSNYRNPLTLGLDIETGGHVFQLVFSNSQAMNDVAIFTNAPGRWDGTKQLYFGFNMYRVF